MRIITGSARGRKLKTPPGLEIRPTAELVKEAMFSAIQFEIEGRVVLDLFAGSGQLGLEALSRGALKAYFVDNSGDSVKIIRENIEHAGFAEQSQSVVRHMPAAAFLRGGTPEPIDIAILDPPYERGHLQKTLPLLAPCMSERGIIICEHEKGCALPESVGDLLERRQYKYGKTGVTIYKISD